MKTSEGNFFSSGSFSQGWVITAEEEHMRTFLITLTTLGAVAVVLPTVAAKAQDRTVVITKHGDHDRSREMYSAQENYVLPCCIITRTSCVTNIVIRHT